MCSKNITKDIIKSSTTVKGSFHQGDLNMFPWESAGNQCVANCNGYYLCNNISCSSVEDKWPR